MKRSILCTATVAVFLLSSVWAFPAGNATVTGESIPLMKGPSFISDEPGAVALHKGQPVTVLSRTSFTDRLAAIPEDYWYLVTFREGGAPFTGYVHGSALAVEEGAAIPIFDPPGFSPKPPVASGTYTVVSRVTAQCTRDEGVVTVPAGTVATHFTIARFDSSFTPCPGEYGSVIGFSIVSSAESGSELFSYEERIADDPAGLQYMKDGLYYMDLDPGNYVVTIRGGPGTVLELSYELVRR